MKIKNVSPGPRGFNSVSGPVLLDPGEETEAKVFEREKEHIEATGWFEVSGDYTANPESAVATVAQAAPAANDELEALKRQLAERDAELAKLKGGNSPSYEAKHRGGGSYSVIDSEGKEVLEKLSKEDAEAFNAMSAEDRAAYVAKK